jgi:phage gp36-like protein
MPILPNMPQTETAAGYSTTVDIIGRHITRADSIIDGKIANRYVVPLSVTPELIKTISQDITSYYSYRSFYTQDNQNESEWVDSFKEAIELLDQIRAGDLDLVGSVTVIEPVDVLGEVDSNTREDMSFFDVDSEYSWAFDSNRLDRIRGDRE